MVAEAIIEARKLACITWQQLGKLSDIAFNQQGSCQPLGRPMRGRGVGKCVGPDGENSCPIAGPGPPVLFSHCEGFWRCALRSRDDPRCSFRCGVETPARNPHSHATQSQRRSTLTAKSIPRTYVLRRDRPQRPSVNCLIKWEKRQVSNVAETHSRICVGLAQSINIIAIFSVGRLMPLLFKQKSIPSFGHPLGAFQVIVMNLARVVRVRLRVKIEDDLHRFAPVSAFGICVK